MQWRTFRFTYRMHGGGTTRSKFQHKPPTVASGLGTMYLRTAFTGSTGKRQNTAQQQQRGAGPAWATPHREERAPPLWCLEQNSGLVSHPSETFPNTAAIPRRQTQNSLFRVEHRCPGPDSFCSPSSWADVAHVWLLPSGREDWYCAVNGFLLIKKIP